MTPNHRPMVATVFDNDFLCEVITKNNKKYNCKRMLSGYLLYYS